MEYLKKLCPSTLLFALFFLPQLGCGILIGNIRPVEEKDHGYSLLDLTQISPLWKRQPKENPNDREIPDVSYQHGQDFVTISFNSACRAKGSPDANLKQYTSELFFGLIPNRNANQVEEKSQEVFSIADLPALSTIANGTLSNEPVKMQAIVLQKNTCIYDLIYIARPEKFSDHASEFMSFARSLRLPN